MSNTPNGSPMGRNRRERQCEAKLLKADWQRASQQHYAKVIKGQELAIDEHIGHFCVGVYKNDRALGDNEKYQRFDAAYEAALRLEARLSAAHS